MRKILLATCAIGLALNFLPGCGSQVAPTMVPPTSTIPASSTHSLEMDGPIHHPRDVGAGSVVVPDGTTVSWTVPFSFCAYFSGIQCGWIAWYPGWCTGGSGAIVPSNSPYDAVGGSVSVSVGHDCTVSGSATFTANPSAAAPNGSRATVLANYDTTQCFINPADGQQVCWGLSGTAAAGTATALAVAVVPPATLPPPVMPQPTPQSPTGGCGPSGGSSARKSVRRPSASSGSSGCETPGPTLSIYETGVTQPVSDGNTHNSVVGKQMILTASFASPQPAGPVQWNWNINGTIVRDYRVVQQDSLTKPGLAPIPWTAPSPQSANPPRAQRSTGSLVRRLL
jgi:hypothetical protein